ncbi:transcription factor A, mitochondrial-like isoform X2 [Microplitis mediator]|uniref:transcription factor A, mitochondrial-like isoform X2 n=1 Tax=Microplitis mediator TaxID=375433 RepID=UPI002554C4B7|nr:transcription factor A, mitochondrial-like isoform X2 [Microplitis mediator]
MACSNLLNLSTSTKCCNFLLARQYSANKLRKLEKKFEIPPRPKRPLNAFMRFSMLNREEIKTEFPGSSASAITKQLGAKWSLCDKSFKDKLQNEFKEEMDDYSRQMMVYEKSLTDEQKQMFKKITIKPSASKKKSEIRMRLEELGKPKKPPTTFIIYMLSKMNTKDPSVKFSEWLGVIAKEWASLSPDKREKYETESKKLMEQYKNEMTQWEEKMIKMGHIDVVRRQVLLELKDKRVNEEKSSQ